MNTSIIDLLRDFQSTLSFQEVAIAMGFSLVASIIAYFMYQYFYGSKHIGAGVHRTFIVGGPAITALFLGIQTSIPLSLGLLGALSFVRFRTPVKDPAEIGFILLLIASSIGAATHNYLITVVLFVLVFVALGLHKIIKNRFNITSTAYLMITLNQAAFQEIELQLTEFLESKLQGLTLETMSVIEGRINLRYRYRPKKNFNKISFSSELNKFGGSAKIESYLG
jgi:hypothetical protein